MQWVGRFVAVALAACVPCVVMATDRSAELERVVASERAFAARAQVVNARQAFVEYFASDAIFFAPFAAPAFPRLRESADWGVNIQWRPAAAAISGAGDMGYTTGPAEYRPSADAAPTGFGHYTSVWQRQTDGRYPGPHRCRHRSPGTTGAHPGLVSSGTVTGGSARARPGATTRRAGSAAPARRTDRRGGAERFTEVLRARAGGRCAAASWRSPAGGGTHRGACRPGHRRRSHSAGRRRRPRWPSPETSALSMAGAAGSARTAEAGDLAYLNVWQQRAGEWRLIVHVSRPVVRARRNSQPRSGRIRRSAPHPALAE